MFLSSLLFSPLLILSSPLLLSLLLSLPFSPLSPLLSSFFLFSLSFSHFLSALSPPFLFLLFCCLFSILLPFISRFLSHVSLLVPSPVSSLRHRRGVERGAARRRVHSRHWQQAAASRSRLGRGLETMEVCRSAAEQDYRTGTPLLLHFIVGECCRRGSTLQP